MGIISEIDKLILREEFDDEDESGRDVARGMDDDDAGVDEIINHLESVKKIAQYMDSLVRDQPDNDVAFEAEIALRKAIRKMEELSKEVYKLKSKTEKEPLISDNEE